MTVTMSPAQADPSPDAPKRRWRVAMLIAICMTLVAVPATFVAGRILTVVTRAS